MTLAEYPICSQDEHLYLKAKMYPSCHRLTPVPTRIAVGGGLTAVGGFPAPGSTDPLRLTGRPMLEAGRWLAMMPKTTGHINKRYKNKTVGAYGWRKGHTTQCLLHSSKV